MLCAIAVTTQGDASMAGGTMQEATFTKVIVMFQSIIRDNLEIPMAIDKISARIGISGRTLRSACHERLGISPANYQRHCRLVAVRCALQRDSVRVTAAATRFGFFELGRFSGAYRAKFGELPSETRPTR
jgi:transcriptional regulator GlxA family with amidase domain